MDPAHLLTALAADRELGAGNVLLRLPVHGADEDMDRLTFDVDVDGIPAWTAMSLRTVTERVAARAAWFAERGIGPRDPVAICVTSAADVFLNYLALTWLGAIPALVNGNLPVEVAADFVRRLRGVGVLLDADHAGLAEYELGAPVLGSSTMLGSSPLGGAAEAGTGDPTRAPEHYRHHPDDPVAITHSSGTTRTPAAIVHSHASLFEAIRAVRLTEARPYGEVRELTVLPAAHTAGIIVLNQALCNGYQLLCLSAQGAGRDGDFGRSGEVILDAIERWRPTGVFGFAVSWAELARHDLAGRDLSSVRIWSNTGDCAHEPHIRKLVACGSHLTYTKERGTHSVLGSKFIDMLGSTEMGHSVFYQVHRLDTDRYDRCVGKVYPFAEVVLLDPATGEQVPAGQVGHVGLRSPTLALGYWNDSVSTYRTRLNGYYLTGDLMYQDPDGFYYHVDRASDAVELGNGDWLYTALSEERILARCADVRDCSVIAARNADGSPVTEVLLVLAEGADPALDRAAAVRAALGEPAARTLRTVLTVADDDVLRGATGKVRKFLMRQRLLAAQPAAVSGVALP